MHHKVTKSDILNIDKEEQTLVIHNQRVYDVSKFCDVHPGGEHYIKCQHGKDVTILMKDGPHTHSKNAYEWLEQYHVADLIPEKEKDQSSNNYSKTKLKRISSPPVEIKDIVDWTRPLLWQVGMLGAKYHDWVDRPVDRKLRLFESDFFEFFSNTKWFLIPMVWIPFSLFLLNHVFMYHSEMVLFDHITALRTMFPIYLLPFVFVLGALSWSFLEYCLHRWLFHASPPVESYSLITIHFLLHGQHHKVPFDKGRLVFPPIAATPFVFILYVALHAFLPTGLALTYLAGIICGYVGYDLTHYYLHYGIIRKGSYFDRLRSYHVSHHFESPDRGFGISSKLWDYPFNTLIKATKKTK